MVVIVLPKVATVVGTFRAAVHTHRRYRTTDEGAETLQVVAEISIGCLLVAPAGGQRLIVVADLMAESKDLKDHRLVPALGHCAEIEDGPHPHLGLNLGNAERMPWAEVDIVAQKEFLFMAAETQHRLVAGRLEA